MTTVQPREPAPQAASPKPAGGGNPGLRTLVERFQRPTWRYLRLLGADVHEADDLMQESFVLLAQRLATGERVVAPAAFLRGVARNLLLGVRRKDRRRPPTVPWLDSVEELVTRDQGALDDGRLDMLRHCVDRLSGRTRDAVQWFHIEGIERAEVGRRLGLQENGLKSLLGRARKALRECVQERESNQQPEKTS